MKVIEKTWDEYWAYWMRVTSPSRHEDPDALVLRVRETLSPPGALLDLACGTGELTAGFAAAGYDVVGIDKAASLIAYAREEYPGPAYHVGDMADVLRHVSGSYDYVTMLGKCFGYLGEAGDFKLLQDIHTILDPGGRAFIQYTPISQRAGMQHRRVWEPLPDGGYSIEWHHFNIPESCYRSNFVHVTNEGEMITVALEEGYHANQVVRCYGTREMHLLCERAGFEVMSHELLKPEDMLLRKP